MSIIIKQIVICFKHNIKGLKFSISKYLFSVLNLIKQNRVNIPYFKLKRWDLISKDDWA